MNIQDLYDRANLQEHLTRLKGLSEAEREDAFEFAFAALVESGLSDHQILAGLREARRILGRKENR